MWLTCSDLQSTLHWQRTTDVVYAPAADMSPVYRSGCRPREVVQLHPAGNELVFIGSCLDFNCSRNQTG